MGLGGFQPRARRFSYILLVGDTAVKFLNSWFYGLVHRLDGLERWAG